MKKTWVIVLISIGVAVLGGAFWLLRSQPPKVSDLEITDAVPLDAVVLCYFERSDLLNETVNNPSSGWSRFVSQESTFLQLLRNIQSRASDNVQAAELLRSKAICSLHPQGKNGLAALVVLALSPNWSPEQWEQLFKTAGTPINEQAYHGLYIHALGAGDSTLYTVVANNRALFSTSQLLLQHAIRHINGDESLNSNEAFRQVMQTAGVYSDVRLFVRHRALDALTAAAGSDRWKSYTQALPFLADWTALDGQVSPNLIHLNGFVFPSFSDNNYLSLLLSQQHANTTAWSMWPSETALSVNIGLSDVPGFLEQYRVFLEKHKWLSGYLQAQAALDEQAQTNTADLFASLYVEEVAAAYLTGTPGGWVSGFKTANPKYAMEQLHNVAAAQQKDFAVAGEENRLYHNPVPGFMGTLLGGVFAQTGDAYFLLLDNWVVFGDHPALLHRLAQAPVSLEKYLKSTQAAQYMIGNSVFSAFVHPDADNNAELLSYFNAACRKHLQQALQGDAFKVASLQMRPSGDKLYTTFFALYDSEEKPAAAQPETPAADTAQAMTAATVSQPATGEAGKEIHRFAVVNHNNKSTEYLVQYGDYSIALLDGNETKQWTLPMDAAMVDTLYQIDFYRNGKLQLLFATTAGKVYLIDRKGQPVAPFPLSLHPAAKRLAVFDYEKNRDYRLFVLQGNTVNVYDKKGRAVDGWQPFTPKDPITRTPVFFRVGGRDFIVVCDEKTMYLLDRRGKERLTLSEPVAVSPDASITVQASPAALKTTTVDGKTVTVSLKDGKVN